MNGKELLRIEDLEIRYETDDGIVYALNGVSLHVDEGETLGLVGETGAGKTTLAKGILRLIQTPPGKIVNGKVYFDGKDILAMTVGEQIEEVIAVHNSNLSKEEIRERAIAMLKRVGISADRIDEYPHQFSGGMKQRVIIAIALACNPKLLLADEPTTALDVTIQAQVLDMIRKLKTEMNTAMILISHDLGVVAQTCDRVAIIYAGRIVETGNLRDIYKNPKHPYTIGLLDSIPSLTKDAKRLKPIKGLMPDPTALPPGCPFAPRCNYATAACSEAVPELADRGNGHLVRCIMDISGKEEQ